MKKILILILVILMSLSSSCNSINPYTDIIDKVVEITCENEYEKSCATGTIISEDGLILTNRHIIENFTTNSSIKINFINDNETYQAEIHDISLEYDLCLLKIERTTNYFKDMTTAINVGDNVFTIGNINGYGLAYQTGIISSQYKNLIFNDSNLLVIQTNIEIDDGSSGGPLYNSKGQLIGIMTFRIKRNGIYVSGISFAIPTKIINQYLEEIKS